MRVDPVRRLATSSSPMIVVDLVVAEALFGHGGERAAHESAPAAGRGTTGARGTEEGRWEAVSAVRRAEGA